MVPKGPMNGTVLALRKIITKQLTRRKQRHKHKPAQSATAGDGHISVQPRYVQLLCVLRVKLQSSGSHRGFSRGPLKTLRRTPEKVFCLSLIVISVIEVLLWSLCADRPLSCSQLKSGPACRTVSGQSTKELTLKTKVTLNCHLFLPPSRFK